MESNKCLHRNIFLLWHQAALLLAGFPFSSIQCILYIKWHQDITVLPEGTFNILPGARETGSPANTISPAQRQPTRQPFIL